MFKWRKSDWKLDLNDNRTSFIERFLVYASFVLLFIATTAEVIQAIDAIRNLMR